MDFVRVEPPEVIEAVQGKDVDDDPDHFRLLVIFDEQDNGKTVGTQRQIHPTPKRRNIVIGFGTVERGGQTLLADAGGRDAQSSAHLPISAVDRSCVACGVRN